MRALLGVAALLLLAAAASAGDEGCGVCHGEQRVAFGESVHRTVQVGCVTCHGGDPAAVDSKDAAHSAQKGFKGKIGRKDAVLACGQCHEDVAKMRPFALRTDALAAYRTSHHGKALFGKDDAEAATCADCHGVHDVRRVKDPASPANRQNVPATCGRCHGDEALMKRHGIQTHAVTDYAQSVHGLRHAHGEPGVPTCADCHDAHAATPPGALEVADVCGSCHRETRDRFRESPHFAASQRGSMRECITCHGNHAVKKPDYGLFDTTEEAHDGLDGRGGTHCLACHDATKETDKGAQTAIAFGRGLRAAETEIKDAAARVDAAAAEGFHVDEERESLEKARRELVRAVPLSHTVDRPHVDSVLRRVHSLVEEALAGCDGIVREERDRRIFGSAGGAVLLGIAAVIALRGRQRKP